jgi:hypothetical protein
MGDQSVQLRKMEAERDRLQEELTTLSESIATKAACELYVNGGVGGWGGGGGGPSRVGACRVDVTACGRPCACVGLALPWVPCSLVKSVESKPDAFSDPANPWTKAKKGGGGGCSIL